MGMRMGALDAQAALNDNTEHHHFPFARRLRLRWRRDTEGQWQPQSEDRHQWEVVCAECGDTDGPASEQSATVQALRGPYSNERHAKRAAEEHFAQN
jgi:hypothetical protein